MRALRDPLRIRARGNHRDNRKRQGEHQELRLDAPLAGVTLCCATGAEERAARVSGLPVVRVGLGARLPLPDGPLLSFGLAGTLTPDLPVAQVVTATRIVDPHGATAWTGPAVDVAGAAEVTACQAEQVVDRPEERRALAASSGAQVVDLESAALALTGRLAGVVRVVSDSPERRLGGLARAANERGDVAWGALLWAFVRAPLVSERAAADAQRALRRLREVAGELGAQAGRTSIR